MSFYELPHESPTEVGEPTNMLLEMSIRNMSFNYGLRYKVETDPDFFNDEGFGHLSVKNMSLTIRFSVLTKNGRA
jgi:hypothetical protein